MSARINEFRDAVTCEIKARMPQLASCEAQFGRFNLEELERNSIRAPAVRFSVLSSKIMSQADAQASAKLSCAAFAIAEGKDRDAAAWAMAEALVLIAHPSAMFGLTKLGVPTELSIQPVWSLALKQRGVVVIAVEWTQELHQLGVNIFDAERHLLTELYINNELEAVDVA
jgi:hypothetical protein